MVTVFVVRKVGKGLAAMVLALGLACGLWAGEAKRDFKIEAGPAKETLLQAAAQGKVEIFMVLGAAGEDVTRALSGSFTPLEALRAMLEGTRLAVVPDSEGNGYAIIRRAETAAKTKEKPDPAMQNKTSNRTIPGDSMNKTDKNFLTALRAALSAALIGGATAASAQEGEDDDGVFELSPFVVSAKEDVGYQATNTLAGTRIRANLEDVAASIQVLTAEFFEDTGSDNLRDALVYTTGTEVNGPGGNFADFGVNSTGFGGNFSESFGTTTRVRGLAAADTTRNFFPSVIGFDNYNSERVEINRGTNSALFGLGSPAGIINHTLIRPIMNSDQGEFSAEYGSYGTTRLTFDYNRALADGEFAIRLAGLHQDEEFRQDFKYDNTRRGFVAAQYDPAFLRDKGILSHVSLQANYEAGESRANRPRTIAPQENISTWLALGKPSWDPSNDSLSATDRNIYNHASTFNLVTAYPDVDTTEVANSYVGIVNPSRPPARDDPSRTIFATFGVPRAWSTIVSGDDPFWRRPSITDPQVFNFYEETFEGPNKFENSDFDGFNTSIEARFFDNRFGVELAYDRQSVQNARTDAGDQEGLLMLHVDYNTHLFDGTPNPNYGRAFLAATTDAIYNEVDLQTRRATAFYRFDFEDVMDSELADWFGSFDLTALYTEQESRSMNLNGFAYTYDGTYGDY